MRRTPTKASIVAGALLACMACRAQPMITDSGYRGTWRRANDRNESLVAIAEVGGRWYFRWLKRSFDKKFRVSCDWDGQCEERLNGMLVATYTIAVRYDAASGRLYTDTIEQRVVPTSLTARYTDVMEVRNAGMELWNFTVVRDGQHFEGDARPNRTFVKIADGVADPPREMTAAR